MVIEKYDIVGNVDNKDNMALATDCDCSGYIDENYSFVITHHCEKHKNLDKIPWHPYP